MAGEPIDGPDSDAGADALVATADHLASAAGAAVMRAGGSAADAAVAAGAVMAVTNPHTGDLGGDLYAVVRTPDGAVSALAGAGRAGVGADPLLVRCEDLTAIPEHGDIRAVTVPGTVDGWLALHERHGRLPLEHVLEAAVTLAATGFRVSPGLAAAAPAILGVAGADDFAEPAYQHRGTLPPDTIVRRPHVAATLSAVAKRGREAFYLGPFGEGLIEMGGGWFARSDLARVQVEWVEPLRVAAWGHDIFAPPPPSQGYLALSGAAIASQLDLGSLSDTSDPGSLDDPTSWPHLLIEAARQAGWDRPEMLYDGADGAALLADDRIAARVAAVSPDVAGDARVTTAGGDTTAICTVDSERMAVSLVQSNASGWGAHLVEPSTGVFLHNRGARFSLRAGHPTELAAGRRPPHTLSPVLVTRPEQGDLRAVVASMGGDSQPQVILQLLARMLKGAATPQDAVAAARWILGDGGFATWDAAGPAHLSVEADAPPAWDERLSGRGHQVVRATAPETRFGHAQVIDVTAEGLRGAADPRSLAGSVVG